MYLQQSWCHTDLPANIFSPIITLIFITTGPPFGSETLGFGVRALPSGACDINGVCPRGLEFHLLHRLFKIFQHFGAMSCFLYLGLKTILEHVVSVLMYSCRNRIFHSWVNLCTLPPSLLCWCGPLQDVEHVLAARGWREVKQIGRTQPRKGFWWCATGIHANVTWNRRYRGPWGSKTFSWCRSRTL